MSQLERQVYRTSTERWRELTINRFAWGSLSPLKGRGESGKTSMHFDEVSPHFRHEKHGRHLYSKCIRRLHPLTAGNHRSRLPTTWAQWYLRFRDRAVRQT